VDQGYQLSSFEELAVDLYFAQDLGESHQLHKRIRLFAGGQSFDLHFFQIVGCGAV
jgi:hypothetical protein